jgi:hypothetical protein
VLAAMRSHPRAAIARSAADEATELPHFAELCEAVLRETSEEEAQKQATWLSVATVAFGPGCGTASTLYRHGTRY